MRISRTANARAFIYARPLKIARIRRCVLLIDVSGREAQRPGVAQPRSPLQAASAPRALQATPTANMHAHGPTRALFLSSRALHRRRISRALPDHDSSQGPRETAAVRAQDGRSPRCASACLHNAYFLVALTSAGGPRARAAPHLGAQRSPSTRARDVSQKTSRLASEVGHLYTSACC